MQPHELLGVRPGAARAEVTDAFRRFALRNHPDRGGDPSQFQAGVDAYRRLSRVRADVVFHRRTRPGLRSIARTLMRRS